MLSQEGVQSEDDRPVPEESGQGTPAEERKCSKVPAKEEGKAVAEKIARTQQFSWYWLPGWRCIPSGAMCKLQKAVHFFQGRGVQS